MSSHKDNWRELAEMLGLSVDEPTPPTPPASPATAQEPAPPVAADDFSADFTKQAAHSTLAPEDRDRFDEQFEETVDVDSDLPSMEVSRDDFPVGEISDFEVSEAEVSETEVSETDSVDAEEPSRDDGPEGDASRDERRGRRRGRRGRRRGRGENGDASDSVAEEKAESPASEERGRRSRPARAEAPDDEVSRDDDDDSDDDFSQDAWADWNVPSWQELIDGLYRPDR